MSYYKSLKEIREFFEGYVEADLVHYPPTHGWRILRYDSEWNLEYTSHRVTLYHALSSIFDLDCFIPYEAYEYCVSVGHYWVDDLLRKIVYDSPLGSGTTDTKTFHEDILTDNSLELDCISLLKEIATFGGYSSLEEIHSKLSEKLNDFK